MSKCEVRVVPVNDIEYFKFLATQLAKPSMRSFWEDRMLINPIETFRYLFMNPSNFVVDLGPREGVLAFVTQTPAYRAFLYGASWGRKAMRCVEERRTAVTAAISGLNLSVVDGITKATNIRAQRAMEASGMRRRGKLVQGLWYNGKAVDGVWYELSREDVNLPPLE